MKILLHACCAPCLIHPAEELKLNGFEVTAYFYNPNIHPLAEYKNRQAAFKDVAAITPVEVIYAEYNPREFFNAVNFKENTPERCLACWSLRLEQSAKFAKEKKFDCFSTTLLVSPYQDQQALKDIGGRIARKEGVDFYYRDFRPGFRQAHKLAKQHGIYCQKYCGCIYSEIERWKQSENH